MGEAPGRGRGGAVPHGVPELESQGGSGLEPAHPRLSPFSLPQQFLRRAPPSSPRPKLIITRLCVYLHGLGIFSEGAFFVLFLFFIQGSEFTWSV